MVRTQMFAESGEIMNIFHDNMQMLPAHSSVGALCDNYPLPTIEGFSKTVENRRLEESGPGFVFIELASSDLHIN